MVFWTGVGLLTGSVVVFVVVALALAGLVSRDPGPAEPLGLLAMGIVGSWLGFRSLRVGAYVSPGVLRVNNWFRTRTVSRSQITAINLRQRRGGEAGPYWCPLVELDEGSSFWISGIECGRGAIPLPERVALVNEIRRLLEVGGA